jgi:tetratricopeptide (TPR) repeat protein
VDSTANGNGSVLGRLYASAARRRAADIWLRRPDDARVLLRPRPGLPPLDGPALSLLAWLELIYARDEERARAAADEALATGEDTPFASATLAELHARHGRHGDAIAVLRRARERFADIPWYTLSLADALVDDGRPDEAIALLEGVVDHPELRRHALKRLSRLTLAAGDKAAARHWYQELIGLGQNYLVYASDFITLGHIQLEAGDRDAARATWRLGVEGYPRNDELHGLLIEHFDENVPRAKPKIERVDERQVGAQRIPVRTRMISARTGLLDVIDEATRGIRRSDDVLVIAESPAAAGQGRILPLELIDPGWVANKLSPFVGSVGPLHSPAGMQGAIMEAGRIRVALGALAGGLTRPFGLHGWFYKVAGPATAMIDDVAAALPPHDHHMLFGPGRPDELASELARALGCAVAIVDANHSTGAWCVGASRGVDRRWVEDALADNPAGNEDEQTPVVLVRRT